EDGIRDFHVTGVQTCALPISCLDEIILAFEFAPHAKEVTWPQDVYLLNDGKRFFRNWSIFKTLWSQWTCEDRTNWSWRNMKSLQIGRASCRDRDENAVDGGAI